MMGLKVYQTHNDTSKENEFCNLIRNSAKHSDKHRPRSIEVQMTLELNGRIITKM